MTSSDFPQDFSLKVKAVHENGGDTGSLGYVKITRIYVTEHAI